MKRMTLADLQEFARILDVGGTRWRSLTEQEITDFKIVPEGATFYKDYKSYDKANRKLMERGVAFQGGTNPKKGLLWTFEL